MSEIADIIKNIAGRSQVANTFPAIVTEKHVDGVDSQKEYFIPVRKLLDVGSEYN